MVETFRNWHHLIQMIDRESVDHGKHRKLSAGLRQQAGSTGVAELTDWRADD